MYKGTSSSSVKKGNNIAVDPNIICHAEQSEASLFNSVLKSIDFSPCGRRPSVHIQLVCYAHRKPRLSESKESSLALQNGSGFVKQNIFNFYIKVWSG